MQFYSLICRSISYLKAIQMLMLGVNGPKQNKTHPSGCTSACLIATTAPVREATDLTMATVVKQQQLGRLLQRWRQGRILQFYEEIRYGYQKKMIGSVTSGNLQYPWIQSHNLLLSSIPLPINFGLNNPGNWNTSMHHTDRVKNS